MPAWYHGDASATTLPILPGSHGPTHEKSSPQTGGHFFATYLDSIAGRGLRALVHSLVQLPSTGGVEKMRRLACDWGLARRWRICHARHARPAYCHCRRRHQLGIAPPPACSCAAKDARRRAAAPPPRNGDALLATPQSVMTCGTKREVSRVIGPSSSRMPRPAGRSATTQLPTNAWRPSNTGSG